MIRKVAIERKARDQASENGVTLSRTRLDSTGLDAAGYGRGEDLRPIGGCFEDDFLICGDDRTSTIGQHDRRASRVRPTSEGERLRTPKACAEVQ